MKTDNTPQSSNLRSPSTTEATNCTGPPHDRQAGQLNPAGASGTPPLRVTGASPG
jgi:hypothetical protein